MKEGTAELKGIIELVSENSALRAECQQMWMALLEVRRGLVRGAEARKLIRIIDNVTDGKDKESKE